MVEKNILDIKNRKELRTWFLENHNRELECWIIAKKGKVKPEGCVWYLDSVEEALCFGWIDTTHKKINGVDMQKFTPRKPRSSWSELNKERCRRLEKLGLMEKTGMDALPDMSDKGFTIDTDLLQALKSNPKAWSYFQQFPDLYQRVRIDTIQRDKRKDIEIFWKRVKKLVQYSEQGKMFGDWNDCGRLINY